MAEKVDFIMVLAFHMVVVGVGPGVIAALRAGLGAKRLNLDFADHAGDLFDLRAIEVRGLAQGFGEPLQWGGFRAWRAGADVLKDFANLAAEDEETHRGGKLVWL